MIKHILDEGRHSQQVKPFATDRQKDKGRKSGLEGSQSHSNQSENTSPADINSQKVIEDDNQSIMSQEATSPAPSDFVNMFYEKKKDLVCETCGEEFEQFDFKGIGKHATENFHYNFKLKGTNLRLGVL